MRLILQKNSQLIKGVLFDLDGVLIDSETLYTEFWSNAEKKYPTGVEDFAYVIKGNNLAKILSTYFPDKEVQADLLRMIDEFERNMQYHIFPGAMELVNSLNQQNIPYAIVTSSDISKMDKLAMQHPDFLNHFNAMVTGNMVSKSKPDPECFLRGAEMIGVDIKDCVVCEDSPSGILAGLNSGAKVIAIATTLRRKDINKDAHKIVDSIADISVDDILSL